jgi:hypothetical protein
MSKFPEDYCARHGGARTTARCKSCEAWREHDRLLQPAGTKPVAEQKTGGSVDYYKCHVADPIDENHPPYTAESIDIIEALGMTFAEGEAFKAIWRTCTGRMGGAVKADNKALYNAEKVEFFGARMVRAAKRSEAE